MWEYVKVREDLRDKTLDEEVAPSLHKVVLGVGHRIYLDPVEFIERTHLTSSMKDLLNEVFKKLSEGSGGTIVLPSAFGGGKTHSLILIYHLLRNPELIKKAGLELNIKTLKDLTLVVIDGMDRRLAPSPLEPIVIKDITIKTLWGYIAHQLGTYESIKDYDEKLISPDMYGVSQILKDRKVVILIDELGIYYRRLATAPRPEDRELLRNYADNVVSFMRLLTEYAKNSKTLVIMSLPAELVGEELESEPGYEEFVEKIGREVLRVAARAGKPVTAPEDFAMILKKRIFEYVDSKGVELASARYSRLHSNYREEFNDIADEVVKTYPFHPYFVSALRDLVEKNKNLQRTRDALRISRIVVRKLLESKNDILLIHPSDIDLRDKDVRPWIITDDYKGFDNVADKIINKTLRELIAPPDLKPEVYRDLAYRLTLYIFLKTYLYKPSLEPRPEFPGKREVITAVYDPLRYESYGLSPKSLSELLDELSGGGVDYRVPHLYSKEGRYWVTTLLDINELVENEADRVEDSEALTKIVEKVRELYARPYDASKGYELGVRVLSYKNDYILPRLEPIDLDERKYVLVTVLEPVSNVRSGVVRSGDLYNLVYYRISGGSLAPRRNRNTVVVMFSGDVIKWKKVLREAKRLIACKRAEKSIDRQFTDKIVIKILKENLNDLYKAIEKGLLQGLFNYFDYLAYPDFEEGSDVVRVVDIVRSGKSLLEVAEVTLRNSGKIVEDTGDFRILLRLLKVSGGWSEELGVGDVERIFYENSAMCMVPERFVRDLILVGLGSLDVGLRRGDKVYYKEVEGLEKPGELRSDDVVIPWVKAAEEQLKMLEGVDEIPSGDCVIRKYYVALYDNKEIPLNELRTLRPHDYLDIFRRSRISLRSEKICDTFELEHVREMTLDLSREVREKVQVEVLVKRVGRFSKNVLLKVSEGDVRPAEGVPDFKALWIITPPVKPGEYTYAIEASSEGTTPKKSEFRLRVSEGVLCSTSIPPLNATCESIRIEKSVPADTLLEVLRYLKKGVRGVKNVEVCKLRVLPYDKFRKDSRIDINAEKISIEELEGLIKSLKGVFGLTAAIVSEYLVIGMPEKGMVESVEEIKKCVEKLSEAETGLMFCCRS